MNHAHLMEALEGAVQQPDPSRFAIELLRAYQLPKATLTQLQNGGDRNVGMLAGDIGVRRKFYFRSVDDGTDLREQAEALADEEVIGRHKIRFVLVTDMRDVIAYDLQADDRLDCALADLPRQYSFFLPLAGYEKAQTHAESAADVKAAERVGRLIDLIRQENALETADDLHALNVFLTRLLFCLFAEDTGIFEPNQFTGILKSTTAENASDFDTRIEEVFDVLARSDRPSDLPAHLASLPYVNGGLFKEHTPVPAMGRRARRQLLNAGDLDWSAINPDIFGSMFQAVIDPEQRGSLGQHYTSVSNIMKVIRPLFIDKLESELERSRGSRKRLERLLTRLQSIKVFDPACGSGNFLIIAYKELRRIEMAVFEAMDALSGGSVPIVPDEQDEMFAKPGQQKLAAPSGQKEIFMSGIRLSQFYGIEIDDFPHEIAQLSLWLAEHQMNEAFRERFGHAEPALPLGHSGNITKGNALRVDWGRVCPKGPEDEVYVCGNPPFGGWKTRTERQNEDMSNVFDSFSQWKSLDYVAAWFWLGRLYVSGSRAEYAFVATSSLFQGEQVSLFWPFILESGLKFIFAYQAFSWKNNAAEQAGVHVCIAGLADNDKYAHSILYSFNGTSLHSKEVKNISPYLVEGKNNCVTGRNSPLADYGRAVDGNNYTKSQPLIFTTEEKDLFVSEYPDARKFIRRVMGAEDFLKGRHVWCLWIGDGDKEEALSIAGIADRVEQVKRDRLNSKKKETRQRASLYPHKFPEIRQPESGNYILIPRVTSHRREYVPMAFMPSEVITNNRVMMVIDADQFLFGLLASRMHMDWMRLVGGRLREDYSYSGSLVFNTFPWPSYTASQRKEVEVLAEEVLLTREETFDRSMAEMYDPDKMPTTLLKAHQALDQAVERLYRDKPFRDTAERQEYLLARYEELIEQERRGLGDLAE